MAVSRRKGKTWLKVAAISAAVVIAYDIAKGKTHTSVGVP